jgi:hypothetical protein
MKRTWTTIGVADVSQSLKWYTRVFAMSDMAGIWRWMTIVCRSRRSNRIENALSWPHAKSPATPAVLGV